MGLLDKLLGFGEIKGPEFTKDFSAEDNIQLNTLTTLLNEVEEKSKIKIEKEILNIMSGLSGEKNVYFELKNSRLPIVCLHDIRLEHNDFVAQFDFIIISSRFILVLETKKLFGNINIDNEGNFTREFQINNKVYKEGMYSPITQNEKHVSLLTEFLKDRKLIKKCPIFSLIVIANDKTIVNKKYAKAEIKNLIIKHDQLIERLKQMFDTNEPLLKHNYMREIAEVIVKENKPIEYDFIKKLDLEIKKEHAKNITEQTLEVTNIVDFEIKTELKTTLEGEMLNKLKQYRSNKAKQLGIKPYFIFNNNELDNLLDVMPVSKEAFLTVSGFGEKKYEQYGEDIIKIIVDQKNKLSDLLKDFRLEVSRLKSIKPYEVFNNQQLDQIIELMPKKLEQFKRIKLYSKQQIESYGLKIIEIIEKNI